MNARAQETIHRILVTDCVRFAAESKTGPSFKVHRESTRLGLYEEAVERGWLRRVAGDDTFNWYQATDAGRALLKEEHG